MKKKMQKFKKMFASGTALVLCLALFTARSDGQKKLSNDFDRDKIQEATTKVIDMINAKGSDAPQEISNDMMKSALTDDAFATVYRTVGEGGASQEIKEVNIAGASDKDIREDYAVVMVRAQYEKKAFICTISFTKDMKLANLYYR